MKHKRHFRAKGKFTMWERTSHSRSRLRSPRSVEPPCNPFAAQLREMLQTYRKTIYEISAITGIDAAYIWRIVRGERVEISREVVIKIGLAFVLTKPQYDVAVAILNPFLDASGYKMLWVERNLRVHDPSQR